MSGGEVEVLPSRPIDEKILALADSHSPVEIAARLGGVLSAKAIAARITELLKARDWLTLAQQDQLITLRMKRIAAEFEGKYLDKDNATVLLRYLKEIGNRLDKRSAATSMDLDRLYGNQGKIMARAYAIALDHMKTQFGDVIDSDEWDAAARDGLLHAEAELAEHESVEA